MTKFCLLLMDKVQMMSSMEINHLLNSIRYQDNFGFILQGMHYKNASFGSSISIRHHYNCLNNLVQKGVYVIDSNENILISENTLGNCLNFGYFELPNFIFEYQFLNAPVLVKRLVLKLLSVKAVTQYFKIGHRKLMDWLKVNRFSKLLDVLISLSDYSWFDTNRWWSYDLKQYVFSFIVKCEQRGTSRFKHNKSSESKIENIFRRRKILYTPKVLSDFVQLLNQYKNDFYLALDFLDQSTSYGNIFRSIICKRTALLKYNY